MEDRADKNMEIGFVSAFICSRGDPFRGDANSPKLALFVDSAPPRTLIVIVTTRIKDSNNINGNKNSSDNNNNSNKNISWVLPPPGNSVY